MKFLQYILPPAALLIITFFLSCGDMYSEIHDSATANRRLQVIETINGGARLLTFDKDNNISVTPHTFPAGNITFGSFADFNRDGNTDIVLIKNADDHDVFLLNSSGEITGSIGYTNSSNAVDAAIADFNNDGYPDIITLSTTSGALYYLENGRNNSFTEMWNSGSVEWNNVLCHGDFDSDGYTDIFVCTSKDQGAGPGRFYKNELSSAGQFTIKSSTAIQTNTMDCASGDFDGDGDLDVLEINNGDQITCYINDGKGNFSTGWQSASGLSTLKLAVADFDGDGDLDAYVATSGAGVSDYYLENTGSGQFDLTNVPDSTFTTTYSVTSGDIDVDGDIDIVISESAAVRLYLNDGQGNFSASQTYAPLGAVTSSAAGVLIR